MLARICQGICPETTNSENILEILLGGGMINALIHSVCATVSQITRSASRNSGPVNFAAAILGRSPRHHAMTPVQSFGFQHQEEPVEQISQQRDHHDTGIHIGAVHTAFLVENIKTESLAASDHLGGGHKDQCDR